ncbi:MAG: class I SAM-dependent RNA methyltransferase [Chloroflexota bacterium]
MKSGKQVMIELKSLAYGGDAVGRLPDGRAAFVPLALPGETVLADVVEERRGFARLALVEVLQPSPQRVQPRCRHFGDCGGCHYQHLPYPDQLAAKSAILRDQLARIAGIAEPPLQPIVASPEPYYYRNHVQFHLDEQGRLGYHRLRSNATLAIQECHLPEAALNGLWPQLDFEALPELERIGLRLGAGDEVLLTLESQALEAPELSVEDLPLSVVHLSPAGALVMAGSPALVIEVLGRPFRVSAGAFFQVNTPMAEAMVEHLLEHLPRFATLGPQTTLLDVYCGVGLFSAFLASRVGRLIGVEVSPAACEDFAVNLDEFDNVALYEAPAEMALPALPARPAGAEPSVVLVDPPREGLDRRALDAIVGLEPAVIAYVSCDPATLARDAARLAAQGYRLAQVTPFDLFPQTYHIESISFFKKA